MRSGDRNALRRRASGYGSRRLQIASDCARSLPFGLRGLTPRRLARMVVRLPALIGYLLVIPRTRVCLSEDPAGKLIAEHLSLKRWGIPRFRLAQGVLHLPSDFSTYMRGRRRQAVRTNVRRARELGVRCGHTTVPAWTPDDRELTHAAPAERWWATDRGGAVVGEAWLTVDGECALLHTMGATGQNVRWLLHTEIVRRLCGSHCRLLLTNSHDALLLPPGQQYFQHLLGYSVARVRPYDPLAATERRRRALLGSLVIAAILAIVGQHALPGPLHPPGYRALVWLTALMAVRVAAGRAGWATLVGGSAGLTIDAFGAASAPEVSLAYFLCGVVLDAQLGLLPRLAKSTIGISCAGVSIMFVTSIAPAFPTLGHHPPSVPWTVPPILGAIVFGVLAAILGQRLGRSFRRRAIAGSLASQ